MRQLEMYVIYRNPRDYPGKFVCRKWLLTDGKPVPMAQPTSVSNSLEEVRAKVPKGLFRMARGPLDDVAVWEVWL